MARVALYVRVSTRSAQTIENQRRELEAVAVARGWEVVDVYEDIGVSGAKGRVGRPAFDRMLRDATRGRVDMIAAWSVDRLGRSLQDLVSFLAELQAIRCDLYLHRQAIDTTTPAGRALFGMLGVFAEFEREIICERIHAGLARARARGKRLGRPRIPAAKEAAIRAALRSGGKGIQKIAREHGVGVSAVQRVRREMAPASASASASVAGEG